MNYVGDMISLTTSDGKRQFFTDDRMHLPVYGNFGAPPTTFITARGYRQHGATEIDYLLEPRAVTVEVYQSGQCSRQEYWDSRARLLDLVRPNRGGPMKLTVRTPDGATRSLTVRADPGPVFGPVAAQQNDWAIRERIDFIAFDPLWEDAEETILLKTGVSDDHLIFPIAFPIQFGVAGRIFEFDIGMYPGTWETYPSFIVTGPYNKITFHNTLTGVIFQLLLPVSYGEQRVIDLTPGRQSIRDENGATRFGELGPNSNLVGFNLQPVTDTEQSIVVTALGAGVGTTVTLRYSARYFGI